MLTPRHLRGLKLDRFRLAAVWDLPSPSYVKSPISQQMHKIGETILSQLLGLDIEKFKEQLPLARRHRASYVIQHHGKVLGLSVSASLIPETDPLRLNMVFTPGYMNIEPHGLDNHYVIGAFVNGESHHRQLDTITKVTIAGWLDVKRAERRSCVAPRKFKSKLSGLVVVPCDRLEPIKTLAAAMAAETERTDEDHQLDSVGASTALDGHRTGACVS